VWNPFRSKLAAGIVGGIENIYMQPGSKVLYLGAASGTTVSHVADLVGPVSISSHLSFSSFFFLLWKLNFILNYRKVPFMQLNSLRDLAVIS